MTGKKIDKCNNTQVMDTFDKLKDYLRTYPDKFVVVTQGTTKRKVKYIDYYVTRVDNESKTAYGFEDQLVYVYSQYDGNNKYLGEYYMGIDENTMTIKDYRSFLSGIDEKELTEIIYTVCANKALRSLNN